mmetsp:Transcript_8958/g.13022  ORF Transcript_8958/g.13022 Transcript_8958/m.13022 type:complete len:586 (+) Transcript_8958:347-2104(+)
MNSTILPCMVLCVWQSIDYSVCSQNRLLGSFLLSNNAINMYFNRLILSLLLATASTANEVPEEEISSSSLRRKAYVIPDESSVQEEPTRRVFVKYRKNMRSNFEAELRKRSSSTATRMHYDFRDMDTFVLTVPESDVAILKQNPTVESVHDDVKRYPMHIPDSVQQQQRNLQQAETVPYGVDLVQAKQAWGVGARGQGVKVCVMDTGVYDHEDLPPITGPAGTPFTDDGVGHGTHCAGTIAAPENGKGVVGVAPEADIYSVKVFSDDGSFAYSSGILAAAQECAAGGANIISMSLGGPLPNLFEILGFRNLLRNGVISVAAAGNFGNGLWSFPASYPGVVSVAAVDENKAKAPFSQFNRQVDVAAPGVDILSTLPMTAPCQICDQIDDFSYGTISGTSMACPHVAGVLALLASFKPEAEPADYIRAIEQSAEDLGAPGKDNEFGNGLVQAYAALEYLNGGPIKSAASPTTKTCGDDMLSFNLKLLTDNNASETTWELRSIVDNGETYLVGSDYENGADIIVRECIPKNCYVFTMYDSEGNGITQGEGSYSVIVDGEKLVDDGGDFDSQDMVSFGDCFEAMYEFLN